MSSFWRSCTCGRPVPTWAQRRTPTKPSSTAAVACWPIFGKAATLVVVTRQSQAVLPGQSSVNFTSAPVWGLGQVVSLEHKSLKYIRMELEDTRVVSEAFLTSAWNLAQGATFDANELACRGDRLFAKHAAAAAHSLKPLATGHKQEPAPRHLAFNERGSLSTERRALQPNEVEVRVHAAGLNFRDVLNVLDIYPRAQPQPPGRRGQWCGEPGG
jgi:hypothetical protein